jgi:hypothetical protein
LTNYRFGLGIAIPSALKNASGPVIAPDSANDLTGVPQLLDLNSLSNLLGSALEMVDALRSEARAVTTAPAPGVAPTRCRYAPGDWARPIDRNQPHQVSELFTETWFRDAYRPGDAIEVYAGAGAGARYLSTTYLVPIYKFGSVVEGNIGPRFRDLGKREYGSLWMRNGHLVKDSGFDQWFPALLGFRQTPMPASPVRASAHAIRVQLPNTMSPAEFEAEWRSALAHCALGEYIQSDLGLRRCALLGVDPMMGVRLTGYQFGSATEVRPAEEIYVIRPHGDADALLVIAERIVLRHVANKVGQQL